MALRPSRGSLNRRWWLLWLGIWLLATLWDRSWLALDHRLPAWDQADYLNAALNHGRALGWLPGGEWQGWGRLLDLSPKLPPAAAIAGAGVMALAGDSTDQASWVLSLWNGLLLLVTGCWARDLALGSQGTDRRGRLTLAAGRVAGRAVWLSALAMALTALLPGLASLRVTYLLEIPLTATCLLALWRLARWRAQPDWQRALLAGGSIGLAMLVKQSSLLVLTVPACWAALACWSRDRRWILRCQALLAASMTMAMVMPWLHHNWITALSGTIRATFTSAALENDPGALQLAGWLYYPTALVGQLGLAIPLAALLGLALRLRLPRLGRNPGGRQVLPSSAGWRWFWLCLISGWLLTTLSPNKDARYAAPLLPLIAIGLAWGWWWLLQAWPRAGAILLSLVAAMGVSNAFVTTQPRRPWPVDAAVARARQAAIANTLVVVPSTPQLNQHTVSYLGTRAGGHTLGRQLGKTAEEIQPTLDGARQILLATGPQESVKHWASRLGDAVRTSGLFQRSGSWPRPDGGILELWERHGDAPIPADFATAFPQLARRLGEGPAGLDAVFSAVAIAHQLDGHFTYQSRVDATARSALLADPRDEDALWSLALLNVLQNRPAAAERWFAALEQLQPGNPWIPAYRAVVLMADWRMPAAHAVVVAGLERSEAEALLQGFADLTAVASGRLWRIPALIENLPVTTATVRGEG